MTVFYLGIFAASVVFSFVLTRYLRDWATTRGWVAAPGQGRHLHSRPLPRLGGVAIFLTFLVSIGVAALVSWWNPRLSFGVSPKELLTILLPAFLIFLLGLYDDLHPVGPYFKFAVRCWPPSCCILAAFAFWPFRCCSASIVFPGFWDFRSPFSGFSALPMLLT